MKKITIVLTVLLGSFATLVQAAPKDNTWYVGGKLGSSQFYDTNWHNRIVNNDSHTHKNQLGASIFGGYQVNSYIGFIVGYDWLGHPSYRGDDMKKDNTSREFKIQGIQLTTKLDYSVTNNLNMYTRIGSMVWHIASNNIDCDYHDTGVSPVFAGGVEWGITNDISTHLDYQWINKIGSSNTISVRPDNSRLSIGISYHFSQENSPIL